MENKIRKQALKENCLYIVPFSDGNDRNVPLPSL
jgi:hypothetical protein